MTLSFRAIRTGAAYALYMDAATRPFATLTERGLVSDYDDGLVSHVNHAIADLTDLRERLAVVRASVEHLHALWDSEAAAERHAEGAWLRAAEYDPQAEAFEAYERANGVIPFEDAFAAAKRSVFA